jgi:hypothetical protein
MNSALTLLRQLVEIPSVSSLSNRRLVEHASRFLHECRWENPDVSLLRLVRE